MSKASQASQNARYYVDGWGKSWWVMSRNHRHVAQCTTKAMATKIAKLLSEDAERKKPWPTEEVDA